MTPRLIASLSLLASAVLCVPVPALGQCGGTDRFRYEFADDPLRVASGGEPSAVAGSELAAVAGSEPGRQDGGDDGPVIAESPSRSAEEAERLYKMERWTEAAVALRRVARGETDDTMGARQIADYRLAIALYRLEFYHASYAILSAIADQPSHLRFSQALPWLATLAMVLPEPAEVQARMGKYTLEQLRPFRDLPRRDIYWQLSYLRGLYDYDNRRYEDAVRAFEGIDPQSPLYLKGQFLTGMSQVQLRRTVPAVKAFQRVTAAAEQDGAGQDRERMRDLAWLSTARAYYSSSLYLEQACAPTINTARISAAVKYWSRIDMGSEFWSDAQFEMSWAYFIAGDYPHALGNLHGVLAPYFSEKLYPEADFLRAVIAFTNCRYDDAITIVAQMWKRYLPIRKEMQLLLDRLAREGRDDAYLGFLYEVRDGRAAVPAAIRPMVGVVLTDRRLLRALAYLRVLDEEEQRFRRLPAGLQGSALGADVIGAVSLARSIAWHNAAGRVRTLYQRGLDELDEQIHNSHLILRDIAAARRERERNPDLPIPEDVTYAQMLPDHEHFQWPFDGEYWKDELGSYRQVVVSRCGR